MHDFQPTLHITRAYPQADKHTYAGGVTAAWQGWPPSWHVGRPHKLYPSIQQSRLPWTSLPGHRLPSLLCRGRASPDFRSIRMQGHRLCRLPKSTQLRELSKAQARSTQCRHFVFPLFDMLRLGVHKADMHTNHFSMFRAGDVMTRSSEHQQS